MCKEFLVNFLKRYILRWKEILRNFQIKTRKFFLKFPKKYLQKIENKYVETKNLASLMLFIKLLITSLKIAGNDSGDKESIWLFGWDF